MRKEQDIAYLGWMLGGDLEAVVSESEVEGSCVSSGFGFSPTDGLGSGYIGTTLDLRLSSRHLRVASRRTSK